MKTVSRFDFSAYHLTGHAAPEAAANSPALPAIPGFRMPPTLARLALAGWLTGFAGAIVVQLAVTASHQPAHAAAMAAAQPHLVAGAAAPAH